MWSFLRKSIPKWAKFPLVILLGLYFLAGLTSLMGLRTIAFNLSDLGALVITILSITIGIRGALMGHKPAVYFLIGWLVFMGGITVFVLRNFGILPYSDFTSFTMMAGNAIEVAVISFALGDRIKSLRVEKEKSQQETIKALQVNETLIREQNIVLEQTVAERTKELQSSNEQLQTIYENLKEAKSKMSTLGQLTAGIAHDINNPLSYIAMSLEPLAEEIKRLESKIDKEEYSGMVQLVGGVQNSTSRILEIVQRLRDYTRTEKQKTESINLNEVIENSLGLLDYNLRGIEVKKDLNAIPLVVANYGRMNQLFLNLFTNNIEAIREKQETGGVLTIKTESMDQKVQVTITDNGVGMSEETIKHIFDPFYTTKTGGTGLGMVEVKEILDEVGAQIKFSRGELDGMRLTLIFKNGLE